MIGCRNRAGCWYNGTNMPSHFPNKSFIISPRTLKTTLTALIHCNLLFCYRTNNKPGANEIIFSIIPKQPAGYIQSSELLPKKWSALLLYNSGQESRMFLFLTLLIDITSCCKHLCVFEWYSCNISCLVFLVLYFSPKGHILLLQLSFILIAFSCPNKHRYICRYN